MGLNRWSGRVLINQLWPQAGNRRSAGPSYWSNPPTWFTIQSSRLSSYVTGHFSRSLTSGPKGGQEAKDVAGTRVINSCCPLDRQKQQQMGGWRDLNLKRKKISADGWTVELGMREVIGHKNCATWWPHQILTTTSQNHTYLIIANDFISLSVIIFGVITPSFTKPSYTFEPAL